MEKIKSIIYNQNPKINLDEISDEECHILYYYFSQSELNNIPFKELKKCIEIFREIIGDLELIIEKNEEVIKGERIRDVSPSSDKSISKPENKKTTLSRDKLIAIIKSSNIIVRKWVIDELIQRKDSTFSKEQLNQQNESLNKLLQKRKKDLVFFSQYLKQGKKTDQLLNSNYFSAFKQEVNQTLNLLSKNNLANLDDFFSVYYNYKGAESAKLEELIFLRMLYDSVRDVSLKKIIYQAYTKFPQETFAAAKTTGLKKIFGK